MFACEAGLQAATILSVGGTSPAYFNLGPADSQALATSWTTTLSFVDVSVFGSLFNQSAGDASGMAYLTTAIGPGATASTLLDAAPFVVPPGASDLELLSVPVLAPETYYLVLVGTSSAPDFGWLYVSFPVAGRRTRRCGRTAFLLECSGRGVSAGIGIRWLRCSRQSGTV